METVTYRGNQDFHGDDTVSLTIDDEGQHGSGGDLTTTASFDVTVNAVNAAPELTAPSAASGNEDADVPVSGFTVFDPDVGTSLGFSRSVAGTLQDKDGIGTGFTHRLPGTGSALAEQDSNIDVDLATGRMLLSTTNADFNHRVN